MKRKGRIVFKGGLFHCEDCGRHFTNVLMAEEHKHAKQKQKGSNKSGEGSHTPDKGDEVHSLWNVWSKRVP